MPPPPYLTMPSQTFKRLAKATSNPDPFPTNSGSNNKNRGKPNTDHYKGPQLRTLSLCPPPFHVSPIMEINAGEEIHTSRQLKYLEENSISSKSCAPDEKQNSHIQASKDIMFAALGVNNQNKNTAFMAAQHKYDFG